MSKKIDEARKHLTKALKKHAEVVGGQAVSLKKAERAAARVAEAATAYAVRYAREQAASGGVSFAKTPEPVFADYLYLAVQIATTFSSSDVTIETTRMRRLVTANSLISFTFNTVIVALLVSVLVSSAR